jgi:hypothetical protein
VGGRVGEWWWAWVPGLVAWVGGEWCAVVVIDKEHGWQTEAPKWEVMQLPKAAGVVTTLGFGQSGCCAPHR